MIRLSTASSDFAPAFTALLNQARETTETVAAIIGDGRARGDACLVDTTARFDRVTLTPEKQARITRKVEQSREAPQTFYTTADAANERPSSPSRSV